MGLTIEPALLVALTSSIATAIAAVSTTFAAVAAWRSAIATGRSITEMREARVQSVRPLIQLAICEHFAPIITKDRRIDGFGGRNKRYRTHSNYKITNISSHRAENVSVKLDNFENILNVLDFSEVDKRIAKNFPQLKVILDDGELSVSSSMGLADVLRADPIEFYAACQHGAVYSVGSIDPGQTVSMEISDDFVDILILRLISSIPMSDAGVLIHTSTPVSTTVRGWLTYTSAASEEIVHEFIQDADVWLSEESRLNFPRNSWHFDIYTSIYPIDVMRSILASPVRRRRMSAQD